MNLNQFPPVKPSAGLAGNLPSRNPNQLYSDTFSVRSEDGHADLSLAKHKDEAALDLRKLGYQSIFDQALHPIDTGGFRAPIKTAGIAPQQFHEYDNPNQINLERYANYTAGQVAASEINQIIAVNRAIEQKNYELAEILLGRNLTAEDFSKVKTVNFVRENYHPLWQYKTFSVKDQASLNSYVAMLKDADRDIRIDRDKENNIVVASHIRYTSNPNNNNSNVSSLSPIPQLEDDDDDTEEQDLEEENEDEASSSSSLKQEALIDTKQIQKDVNESAERLNEINLELEDLKNYLKPAIEFDDPYDILARSQVNSEKSILNRYKNISAHTYKKLIQLQGDKSHDNIDPNKKGVKTELANYYASIVSGQLDFNRLRNRAQYFARKEENFNTLSRESKDLQKILQKAKTGHGIVYKPKHKRRPLQREVITLKDLPLEGDGVITHETVIKPTRNKMKRSLIVSLTNVKLKKMMELCMGEIDAGNDSREIKEDLALVTQLLYDRGAIPKLKIKRIESDYIMRRT